MSRALRRFAAIAVALVAGLVLASCRVDVAVLVELAPDGTGEVTVTATADAELVARAAGLAEELRFDDAAAAGWVIEGPAATDDGGLTVTLRHAAASAAEVSNLLASLGPPFVDIGLSRTVSPEDERDVTVTLSGRLELTDGFAAFADADLLAAAGGVPFADELRAAGATPAESLSVHLRAELPGEVAATTGQRTDGAIEWEAPLDGSRLDLATTTRQRPAAGGGWAGPVAGLALALLVVWVVAAGAFIGYVASARRRRAVRRAGPVRRR